MKPIVPKSKPKRIQAQGPYADLALHTIGWRAFQDLASQVCEERLKTSVTVHYQAKDGGQDAVFHVSGAGKTEPSVGTVQVKYSTNPKRSLTLSDLKPELENLKELVAAGEAGRYIFISNMSVTAPNAKAIKAKLREYGVEQPDVWGKQQVTLTIRESSKLRALVPQVYGLGDLSTILDERAIEQTKATLNAWLPKLRAYVPTESHKRAVRVLDRHGVVLLLGNPVSGKSTIGAILSTMAIEDEDHSVIQISSPEEFVEHWNPHNKNRFFWIDDAFGSSVMDSDNVQGWAKTFSKVSAAINGGNRFLFTSRNYIYNIAAKRLGTRNLHLFRSGDATVDVGALSKNEQQQILYNHIKHGEQAESWKRKTKEFLEEVADVEGFLPGISERLGNPDFTKNLSLTKDSLCDFMANPKDHLIQVIDELESEQFAALALIYVHRGRLELANLDDDAVMAIEKTTGHVAQEIITRLRELAGSFSREMSESSDQVWGFEHPTIADAITAILDMHPNMTSALVRGGPIEKVLSQFVCENGPVIQNAAKIPVSLNDALNSRLLDTPNHVMTNHNLFEFLAFRASDDVVVHQFKNQNDLMGRVTLSLGRTSSSAKNRAAARAYALGALDDIDRLLTSQEFIDGAVTTLDLSWTEEDDLLALTEPRALLSLGASLSFMIANNFDELLKGRRNGIDLDAGIEDQYEVISSGLKTFETLLDGSETLLNFWGVMDAKDFLGEANKRLRDEIDEVLQEQNEHRATQEETGDWDMFSDNQPTPPKPDQTKISNSRSIFEDVDK